ncbi:MAG: hypothetical protein GNW80_16225 [Asgard group archaeon]|nr:hypothetical protein [Asgard group archaeon]
MKDVLPKCPKCGNAKFVQKVPKVGELKLFIIEIKNLEEKIRSINDSQDKTILEKYLESRKKALDIKIKETSGVNVETIIVFCKNCWEIIGTSDNKY